jgi:transcriptional regulator with XRE-family HTH domain
VSSQAQQARQALGARLRELRKDAGLNGRALAAAAGWQLSKVSRIEHGRRSAAEDDIRVWCLHTQAEDQIPDLIATARNTEAMWLEWRRTLRTGTKIRQRQFIGLYEQTQIFRVYNPTVVWGTLQTVEYAEAHAPPSNRLLRDPGRR